MNKLPPKLKNGKSIKNSFTLTELPVIIATVAIMAAAFLLTGCGKKPATPPPTVTQPAAQAPATQPTQHAAQAPATQHAGQAPATPPVNRAPPSSLNLPIPAAAANLYTAPPGTPVNYQQINSRVRGWCFQYGRPPTNFEEFAATAGISIPPPPPGMKYQFDDRLHCRLVKAK
jgi:hypothetical protein